ncbi:TPA: hypothetical protein N0F65_007312 [Lagenidium giganteum]|uniref:Uncharacterized protein n=1 Tax=Lagenidium giganteum TaxID=4803 RepID=A0AAV2Z9W5_9STRA|nr:TPA: hypothetical protein N0F65_007312 [Lagenidium giganteum]
MGWQRACYNLKCILWDRIQVYVRVNIQPVIVDLAHAWSRCLVYTPTLLRSPADRIRLGESQGRRWTSIYGWYDIYGGAMLAVWCRAGLVRGD